MRASVSVRPQRALSVQRPCVLTRMAPSRILSSNHDALEAAKKELQNHIDTLGWPGALLPGSPEVCSSTAQPEFQLAPKHDVELV